MKRLILAALIGIGLIASTQSRSEAALRLRLEDTVNNVGIIIEDGGVGDLNPVVGAVTFIGTVGSFEVNVSTGVSKPVIGGGGISYSEMDLNSINTTTTGGSLQMILEDNNFPSVPQPDGQSSFITTIGGTFTGAVGTFVTAESFVDPTNATITGALIVPLPAPLPALAAVPVTAIQGMNETFLTSPFSATDVQSFVKSGPYSMFLEVNITIVGPGSASFDHNILVPTVPEPASMVIWSLGAGALGLGGFWRRKRAAV